MSEHEWINKFVKQDRIIYSLSHLQSDNGSKARQIHIIFVKCVTLRCPHSDITRHETKDKTNQCVHSSFYQSLPHQRHHR